MSEGVIADFRITEEILKHFIKKVAGGRGFFRPPRIMICIPSGITTVEKRAVLEAASQAGAKQVYLVTEPIAAAIGCGLDISAPSGNMVVDIGGGTTDIAVISLGGEVTSESLRIGGEHLEEAIQRYIQRIYNLAIGDRTAEEIKKSIASAYPEASNTLSIRGRDLITGLPATVEISAVDIHPPALEEPITSIIDAILAVLEVTPPRIGRGYHQQRDGLDGRRCAARWYGPLDTRANGRTRHARRRPPLELCGARHGRNFRKPGRDSARLYL